MRAQGSRRRWGQLNLGGVGFLAGRVLQLPSPACAGRSQLVPVVVGGCLVVGAASALQRAGGCVWPAHRSVWCQRGVRLGVRQLVAVSWLLFSLVSCARALRLTLLLFCSVLRVLAVCCRTSSCVAAGDDLLRSCHKCFCTCNLVDVTISHRNLCHQGTHKTARHPPQAQQEAAQRTHN